MRNTDSRWRSPSRACWRSRACGGDDERAPPAAAAPRATAPCRARSPSTARRRSFPFAEAAAELFNEENPDVRITVGQSGTGGGFEKFCAGETDISDASRPIEDDEEARSARRPASRTARSRSPTTASPSSTNKDLAVDCLTTDQLKQIWNKGSKVKSLSRGRQRLPDTALSLYGPGTDSGTFDFFTAEINGEEGVTREDYEASEDDNQLVTGVAGDEGGLGYFGFSYYEGRRTSSTSSASTAATAASSRRRDDPGRLLQAALAPAVHVPRARRRCSRPEVKAFMDFTVANSADDRRRRPRSCR